jgi:hypothetical protein
VLAPRVAAEPPHGWTATEIAKPKIAESSGAHFTSWEALADGKHEAVLVTGCLATPIPGWVEDMRPAVEGRTVAFAGASTSMITGAPTDARAAQDGLLDLRAANNLAGPVIGRARTFVGFDESSVFTCFAACGTKTREALHSDCERAVIEARLEGSHPPPPPGVALRGATWAVHHPRPVALGGAALVVVLGVLAVVVRRRPRSRIDRA